MKQRVPNGVRAWRLGALHVGASVFLLMAAVTLVKTGRDALYFQKDGIFDLPKAYLGIAILSLPMALATLGLMRGVGPRRARVAAPLIMAVVLIAFHGVVRPGSGPLMTAFFILVPLAFGVLFSVTWLLLPEVLHRTPPEQVTRSYALVGTASILGGVAGGALARALAPWLEPQHLLLVGAAVLGASAAVIALTHARFLGASTRAAARAPSREDFRCVLEHRYSFLLLAVGMTAAFAGVLIKFQFYLAAAASGDAGRELTAFFGGFYMILNLVGLLVQIFLTPRIQRRIGVHGSLLIMPVALLGGAGALLVNATLLTRSGLRLLEGGLKMSIHRSNWEQAYLPMSYAHRSAAKLLVDGMSVRIAEGLAATVLLLWLRFVGLSTLRLGWMTVLLLVAISLWIGLTRLLRRSLAPVASQARETDGMVLKLPLPDS
ncbi:MAG: hypothetical protein O7F16_06295 [Acidobacteria bacterium]|nr:hypothetical protein [Acidobacteriota bacterium]